MIRLAPEDARAIAREMVDLLKAEGLVLAAPAAPPAGGLLTAADVARRFSLGRDWVYRHADQLGAMRLGDGPKAPVRFDPLRVAEALSTRGDSERSRGGATRGAVRSARAATEALVPNALESLPKQWRDAVLGGEA